MKIILILGCWGRAEDGIDLCGGLSNEILDITRSSQINVEIADYLDVNFRLFDKPLYTNVHTVIWNIQSKFSTEQSQVFSERMFERMEEFCITHSKCGLFLRLEMQDNEKE